MSTILNNIFTFSPAEMFILWTNNKYINKLPTHIQAQAMSTSAGINSPSFAQKLLVQDAHLYYKCYKLSETLSCELSKITTNQRKVWNN